MDTQRLILFIVFSLSTILLWQEWEKSRQPSHVLAPTSATTAKSLSGADLPNYANPTVSTGLPDATTTLQGGGKVKVTTDYLLAEIDVMGGDIRRLELTKHRDGKNPIQNFVLFQETADHIYVAQTGLLEPRFPNLPTHRTLYSVGSKSYQLAPGQDALTVRMEAPDIGGIKIAKLFTFKRSSYVVEVSYEISNNSKEVIQPAAYYRFLRDSKAPSGDNLFVHTFTGPAIYTAQEKFQKIGFKEIDKGKDDYAKACNNGWIGLVQHYFVAAWLPKNNQSSLSSCKEQIDRQFEIKKVGQDLYSAGLIMELGKINPGSVVHFTIPLYAGPQDMDIISKLAPGLELTKDYGWFKVIASPLFWVLAKIHAWVGNWGVAIIMLTLLVKLLFYPLSAASYRSMAQMRVVAPRLQKLKEQYGDDRQRLHQAMMELYKTEKINPLGGCLPILVQIPVFISLYWALLASVELRQAPFMLWIQDLSAQDPYYILPLLMGITMVLQSRMNPAPPDPIQARVMKLMPYIFSVFFFFFPAGLVLYWLVNNLLSIIQQWTITRSIERAKLAHGKH